MPVTGRPQTRRNGALRLAEPTEGQPRGRDVEEGQETREQEEEAVPGRRQEGQWAPEQWQQQTPGCSRLSY